MAAFRGQQKKKNFGLVFEPIQLGVAADPAQIVCFGFPSDVGKSTTSAHLLLKDPESIKALVELERQLELKANPEGVVLNSSVLRSVTLENDTDYPVVRCKVTRDEENYEAVDAWTTGAATSLDGLAFGHHIITKVNPVVWVRNKECGITLYVNQLKCLGQAQVGLGRRERAPVLWK